MSIWRGGAGGGRAGDALCPLGPACDVQAAGRAAYAEQVDTTEALCSAKSGAVRTAAGGNLMSQGLSMLWLGLSCLVDRLGTSWVKPFGPLPVAIHGLVEGRNQPAVSGQLLADAHCLLGDSGAVNLVLPWRSFEQRKDVEFFRREGDARVADWTPEVTGEEKYLLPMALRGATWPMAVPPGMGVLSMHSRLVACGENNMSL